MRVKEKYKQQVKNDEDQDIGNFGDFNRPGRAATPPLKGGELLISLS